MTLLLILAPIADAQGQPEIRISPSPLVFTEGTDTSVTISLSEQPTSDVVVTINPQDLYICVTRSCFNVLTNRTQVTIPAGEWDTGVTYRFGAENIATDPDTEDNTGTIRFTAERHQEFNLSYTMRDDNRPYPEFEFSDSSSFTLQEDGASRIIGIGPGRIPDAPVRIYASSSDPGALSVEPEVQYFASRSIGNFTVSPVQDSDIRDEEVTITFELRQSNGDDLPGGNTSTRATVTVDDDETRGFVVPAETLEVKEGGGGRFSVRLSERPSTNVRVQISTQRNSDISLNRTELTFTTVNWGEDQIVPFTIRQDSDSNSELDVINLLAIGGDYKDVVGEVSVQIQDDEVPQVTGMPTSAQVAEGGTLKVDTFRLTVRPADDVTVKLASSDTSRLTLSPDTLMFTRGNWSIGQEVEFSGVEDGDLLDDEILVDVTASGAPGFEGVMGSFRVGITDVSSRTISAVGIGLSDLTEGMTEGLIAVRLNSRPSGDVEVRVGVPGYVGNDFTICAPGRECDEAMTFTQSNWNIVQRFRVLPNEDQDIQDFEGRLMITASGADYTGAPEVSVNLKITDNDRPGLTLSDSTIDVNEGASGSFTVKLSHKPVTQVSVMTTAEGSRHLTSVEPAYLVFSPDDWNIPQTVYVTAGTDADGYDERTFVALSAEGDRISGGSDNPYQSLTDSVGVNIIDSQEDQAALEISIRYDILQLWIEGGAASVVVQLRSRPDTEIVNLTMTVDPMDVSKVASATTVSASIGRDEWRTKRVIMNVVLAEDDDTTNDDLTFAVTASGGNYEGISETFTFTVFDNDVNNLAIMPDSINLGAMYESGNAVRYYVRLAKQPTGDVTVTATSSDTGAALVDTDPNQTGNQNTLTITAAEWRNPHIVTVAPVQDSDSQVEQGTINVSASGGGYSGITASAPFTVTDDDATVSPPVTPTAPQTFTITSDAMREVDTTAVAGKIYVRLSEQPSGTVTFTPTFSSTKLSGSSSTFTVAAADWNSDNEFALNGQLDSDTDDNDVTITLSANGGGYSNFSKAHRVTVFDSANYAIAAAPVDPYADVVEEGSAVQYSVRLTRAPGTDETVVVDVTSSSPDVVVDTDPDTTGDQSSLSFDTASNLWSQLQTVSITAAADDDRDSEEVTITFSTDNDGLYQNTQDVALSLMVVDNDPIPSPVSGAGLSNIANISGSEGAAVSRSVQLSVQPEETVQLNLVSNNSDITFASDSAGSNPITSLTFTRDNWDTSQTFYTVLGQDMDTVDDAATVLLVGVGGGYGGVTGSYTVAVDDDEDVMSTFMDFVEFSIGNSFTLEEGKKHRIGVRLNAPPISGVLFSNERSNSGDVGSYVYETEYSASGDTSALLFTSDNWNIYQYFSITPFIDLNATDDTKQLHLRLQDMRAVDIGQGSHLSDIVSLSTGSSLLEIGTEGNITITDTVSASIELAENTISVAEGGAAVYSVKLGAWDEIRGTDTKEVTVSGISSDTTAVSNSSTSLTFTSSNWNIPQDLQFDTVEDADSDDEQVTLTLTASGGGYSSISTQATANIRDNDTASLVMSENSVALDEGGSPESVTVRLGSQPSGNVVIRLGSSDAGAVWADANPATTGTQDNLTFTPINWGTAQLINVLAFDDADSVDEDASITLSAAGGGYDGITASIGVTVEDDEEPGLTLSPKSIRMNEGAVANLDVRLSTIPSSDVTVALTMPSGVQDSLATDLSTLIFTPDSWNVGQSFTLTALRDADSRDELIELTLTNSGGGFTGTGGSVQVRIDDDNPNLMLSLADRETLRIPEGGSETFTVRLDQDPGAQGAEFELSLSGGDGIGFDTNPLVVGDQTMLNFTSANWSTAQTVEVFSIQDENAVNEVATLSLISDNDLTPVTVSLEVEDGDHAELAGVPAAVVVIDEGDSATIRNFRLTAEPLGDVALNFVPSSTGSVSLDTNPSVSGNQSTLRFTLENWDIPRSIVVSALEDLDGIDNEITINITATGGAFETLAGSFEIQVDDNDIRGVSVTAASGSTAVLQEGGSGIKIYDVALTTQPSGNVTVQISSSAPDSVHHCRVTSPSLSQCVESLIFTPDNYSTTQQLVLGAREDDNTVGETVFFSFLPSGADYQDAPITPISFSESIIDDDTAGLTFSASTLTVEEGGFGSFTVELDSEPTGSVTVDITETTASSAPVSIDMSSLTFTADNWDIPQTKQVFVGFDTSASDVTGTVTMTASGGGYDGVTNTLNLSITNTTALATNLVLGNAIRIVNEVEGNTAGSSNVAGRQSVKLGSQPSDNVRVTFSSPNSDISVGGTNGAALTYLDFTQSNWNIEQDYWVVAAEDDDDAEDESTTLKLSASGGGYSGVTIEQVVNIADNDSPSISFFPGSSASPVTVDEGGAPRTFTMVLNHRPPSNVSFSLDSSVIYERSRFQVSPATVTFTPGNWNQPQTLSLSHQGDVFNAFNSTSIDLYLKATGGGKFSTTNSGRWSFKASSLNDPDRAKIVMTPSVVAVYEGSSADVRYSLSHNCYSTIDVSNSDYSITINEEIAAGDDATAVTLSQLRLDGTTAVVQPAYSSINWNSEQILRITAPQDADTDSETVRVKLKGMQAVTTPGCDGLEGEVTVRVIDANAGPLVLLSKSVLDLEEGDEEGTLTAVLSERPTSSVRVSVSSASEKIEVDADSSITGRQEEIVFTTSDWDTPKTIRVIPLHDSDIEDESISITVSSSVGGSNFSESVLVNIEDDDVPGIVLSATSLLIDEGSTDTFQVRLNAPPTSGNTNVTVIQPSITSVTADTDLNLAANQTRLTFTADNWDILQTVRVAVGDDDNAFDETASVGLRSVGGGFEVSASVDIIIQNNDERGFLLEPETVELSEGESTDVMVTLASKPSQDVSFIVETPMVGLTSSITGSSTFTPSSWNTPRRVTLSLAEDDNGFNENTTITFKVSGSAGEYTGVLAAFSPSISDDDTAAVLTEQTGGAALREGGSGSFGIKLATQPGGEGSGDVLVVPSCDNCTQLSFSPANLTFTESNWDTWAYFTINALQDDDSVDADVEVRFSASGRDYDEMAAFLPFTVVDDEAPGVVFSETLVALSESSSAGHSTKVRLSQQPSGDVQLTFDTSGLLKAALDTDQGVANNQNTLTFTTTNWDDEQDVLLKPVEDADAMDESGSIAVAASGGGYDNITSSLRFSVEDDETPGLVCGPTVCSASQTQIEAAAGTVRSIKLGSEPEGGVTVFLRSSNSDVTFADGSAQQVPLTSLSFDATNWNVDQNFQTVIAEDTDGANETAVITLSAGSNRAGGAYSNVSESYTLNITDDEEMDIDILLSSGDAANNRLSVDEGGRAFFDVNLTVRPTSSVSLSLSAADIAKGYALSPANQTFNSANFRVSQRFYISPPSDGDTLDEDVSVTLMMSGGEYTGKTKTLYLSVDDDERPDLLITPGKLSVAEGLTQTFTIQLLAEPRNRPTSQGNSGSSSRYDVEVAITSGDTSAVRILTPSLSFSASEWNVPKSVLLRGVEDSNQLSESPSITLTASATACSGCPIPDYNGISKTISVKTLDDDTPNLHLSDLLLNINEVGADGRFTVNLMSQPSADVEVSVTSGDSGAVTVSPSILNFTAQNWNQPRTVTVHPVTDVDGEDESVVVTVSGTGGGYLNTTNNLTVKVKDEDPALLQLTKNRLLLAEGNTATFAVSLSAAPVASMSVALTSPDVDAVSVRPDILEFSPDDWNARTRIVTVTGEPDLDALDEDVKLELKATGGSYTDVSVQVDVDVVDTDFAELSLPSRVQIVEASEATFNVRLRSQPEVPVTLTLMQPDNPDVTLDANEFIPGDQTQMIFGIGNWSVSQTVKLIARDDGDARDEPTSISVVASGGDYDGISATIDVSLIDDDRVRLLLVPDKNLAVSEGNSSGGTFSVRLGSLPSGDVTVTPTISADDASKLSVSPSSLTFNATNWQTTRDITVTPQNDADPVDERVVINLATAGGGYDNRSESFLVEITDDDVAELLIEAPPNPDPDPEVELKCPADDVYCVKEDDANGKAIRLKLSAQPSEDVTIEISSNNTNSVRAASQTLTFTSTDWNQAKSATIQAVADSNAFEEDVTITFSASGGGYDDVTATVKARAIEIDEAGLVLPNEVNVSEGGSATFAVRLKAQPLLPAVVTVAQPSNSDVRIDTNPEEEGFQTTLSFTPGTWDVEQEITVFAASDEDALVEETDVNLTLLGRDYPAGGILDAVTVKILENEQLGILVTGGPLTAYEGGEGGEEGEDEIQIRLLSKPTVNVTVDASMSPANALLMRVEPASLTFTPDNWNVDQTMTVEGIEDADTKDHPGLSFVLNPDGGEYSGGGFSPVVEVTVIDNDQIQNADLVISTNMLTVLEGGSQAFSVKLAVQPEGDVRLRVASMDPLAASVSPPELTFTIDNWDIEQIVTITGVQDLFDMEDTETRIVFSAIGGGYSGVGAGKDISVMIVDAEGSEADVVKQVLAEAGRSALIGTQEVIGRRLDATPGLRTATVAGREISLSRQASRDLASGFAGIAGAQELGEERFDGFWFGHERQSTDWLGGIELKDGKPLQKAPEISTLGRSLPLLGNFTYDLSADRGVGWTVWGRLDQRQFSGELEATLPDQTEGQSYESSQSSVWLGFDRRLVSGAVIGIAVSQSTGEGSYMVHRSMLEMDTSMTNYLSYFELGLGAEGRLRIMLGSGTGDMTVTPSAGPISTVNLTTVLGSLGFRWPLARVGQGRLVLTGSLGLSEVSTDEASSQCSQNSCTRIDPQELNHGAAISEIDAANNSARIGIQLEPRPWTFGREWNLEPRIGISLRQDSGDGIEGSGAELTSALKLKTPSERFSVDIGMQYLGTHSAAELSEEWGASLEFALHSIDDSGRGLSLSIGPQWGLRDTGLLERTEAFAVNGAAGRGRASAARQQEASLGARLGYGLDTLGGMLTPFAEYNFTGGTYASSRQNLGVRFNTTDKLEAKLFSEQQNVQGGANTNGFGFEIRKLY